MYITLTTNPSDMMRRIIALLLFVFFAADAFAQSSDAADRPWAGTLSKVFQLVKKHSLFRRQVNWDLLEREVLAGANGPVDYKVFKSRIALLYSSIGDSHGGLYIRGEKLGSDRAKVIGDSLLRELRGVSGLKAQMLEGRYGYLLVPANSTRDNITKLSQAIQDTLCVLASKGMEGIILDLRAHEGGSILPGFTGLHQLIGKGVVGAFSNLEGSERDVWKLQGGRYYHKGKVAGSVKPGCRIEGSMKVAVLLGPVTASAGEMLAIALKGRRHTVFVGEQTYGLTTGNVTFTVDGMMLAVAASVSQDREGRSYAKGIQPDITVIGGDCFSGLEKDTKVHAALKWMKGN